MSKAKVLIVEDEAIVALDMKKTLEEFDFDVTDIASSSKSVLNSINSQRPDIILMDINLKGEQDGIQIIEQMQYKDNIPVIYLTSYSDENTIARAINTNPVTYLLKPFKDEDLKSNILLGLYKSRCEEKFMINDNLLNLGNNYYYDYENSKLFLKNEPVKLSKKESLLLKLLIESRGETIKFEELENKIWPNINVSDSTLRTLIYRLRMRLNNKLIESIPLLGCRLN
jgi:DNA-binding response OmpR family regulator